MKISITCENFPVRMVDRMATELSKQGISVEIQVGFFDTLFVTTNVEDVTKAQVFCILVDKYRFAHGVDGGDPNEEES